MFRLRIDRLREAAAQHGDTTRHAIYRRTGISESSCYRILNGESQPDLNSLLRFAEAYSVSVESLMKRVDESVPAA